MKRKLVSAAAALLLLPILAGCAAQATEGPRPVASDGTGKVPSPSGPKLNDHGHIDKKLGEAGVIRFPGTETDAISFTIVSVGDAPACDSPTSSGLPPENGEYLTLTLRIQTSPDYLKLMAGHNPLRVFWQDWTGYYPDGKKMETTPRGLDCFPEEQSVPLDIPAGADITANYVVDFAPGVTSISWTPAYVLTPQKPPGWEWEISGS